jgi:hypothetical protein
VPSNQPPDLNRRYGSTGFVSDARGCCHQRYLPFALPGGPHATLAQAIPALVHDAVPLTLGFLYVSAAISCCFLILLYGEERADGWGNLAAPQGRVTTLSVALLYLYGGVCYARFLISIGEFMSPAGRVESNLIAGFLLYSVTGLLAGVFAVMVCFLAALRFAKPEDDDALEVFAFPAFLVFRRFFGGAWITHQAAITDFECDAGGP